MIPSQEWWQRGTFYRHDGKHDIFYIKSDQKNAPTVLMLHGTYLSSYVFMPMWEKMDCNLVALDFLGHGFSDKPEQTYTIDQQADIVIGLLAQIGLSPPDLYVFAWDYGVTVYTEICSRGHTFKKAMLLNAGLYPEIHSPTTGMSLLQQMPWLGNYITYDTFRSAQLESWGTTSISDENEQTFKELWKIVTYNDGLRVYGSLTHYIEDRKQKRYLWVPTLESMKNATLLFGTRDTISGLDMILQFQMRNPGKTDSIILLRNTGHFPTLESPRICAHHLSQLIK